MYKKILIPLDGSAFAEQVIACVQPFAEKLGSALVLLQVTTPLEVLMTLANPGVPAPAVAMFDPQPLPDAEPTAAEECLSRVVEPLRKQRYSVEYELPAGHAAAVIIERAQAVGVDLIAMTTHGRGGLGRLVFGSVADAVLRHAPCPILLVRVRDEQALAARSAA